MLQSLNITFDEVKVGVDLSYKDAQIIMDYIKDDQIKVFNAKKDLQVKKAIEDYKQGRSTMRSVLKVPV